MFMRSGFGLSKSNRNVWLIATIIALLAWLAILRASLPVKSVQPAQPVHSGEVDLGKLPISFVPNAGQTDPSVRFMAHAPGGVFYFTRSGVSLSLQPAGGTVSYDARISFLGARAAPDMLSGPISEGEVNYITGNDPNQWRTGLPTYSSVTYRDLYKGISLTYDGSGGKMKGTYTINPMVDAGQIRWRYEGASKVSIDEGGNLQAVLGAPMSGSESVTVTEQAPQAWQDIEGSRNPVSVEYSAMPDGSIGFAVGGYNPAYPLTIDPTLTYSSYLGGGSRDEGRGIAVDAQGNIYVSGLTSSTNFPTQNPYQPTLAGNLDVFVTKLNADGSALIYSTYLGGTGLDNAEGLAVDSSGSAYVTGWTASTNYPVQNSFQPNYNGGQYDGFVTKLSAQGSSLDYSTYLGATFFDQAMDIAVDSSGSAYVTGNTTSTDFPLANAFQSTNPGTGAFVTKFSPSGTGLVYSTYLGGSLADRGDSIALLGDNAYITGQTTSTNFPLVNPAQGSSGGAQDAFVTRFNSAGSALVYSTYLGGSSTDWGLGVGVDPGGYAYVTGYTISTNFPLQNAFQGTFAGATDAFVTKVNPAGGAWAYSTYLGGSQNDQGNSIVADSQGEAYITGYTSSGGDFPLRNPVQPTFGGNIDAFVTKLSGNGSSLVYSTFLGGSGVDMGQYVAVDSTGNAYVTGNASTNFPVVNPYQPANAGGSDAFISKIYEPLATPTNTPIGPTATNTTVAPSATRTATRTLTAIPTNTRTRTAIPTNTRVASTTPISTRRATFTPAPTFTPPTTNTATSTATPGGASPTPCAISFSDVHTADYFYPAISYLYCRGAISGYADGTFRPYNNTTRGQLVKIVVLAENWPLYAPSSPTFSDVPATNPFYAHIETAVQHQMISGYGDGTFRPNNNVTRGQVCKIISIAERWAVIDPVDPHFSDVGVDNPFYIFIETAFSKGVISGYADGAFRWGANATRGQLSKIVYNAITLPR